MRKLKKKKKQPSKKLKKLIEFRCVKIFKNNTLIFILMCCALAGKKQCMAII